jgi:hypothetical protein
VLLTRPAESVLATGLDRGGAAFLDACACGASIERAVGSALDAAPDTDIAALIAQLLQAGAFTGLAPATRLD